MPITRTREQIQRDIDDAQGLAKNNLKAGDQPDYDSAAGAARDYRIIEVILLVELQLVGLRELIEGQGGN